jgi:hypothetical protein
MQSTGEMCWLHPQLLTGICAHIICPDTPAACHSLNVPYCRGLSDASFMHLFLSIFPAVVEAFWFVFLRCAAFHFEYSLISAQSPDHRVAIRRRHSIWRPVRRSHAIPIPPPPPTPRTVIPHKCMCHPLCRLGGCNVSSACFPQIVQSVLSLQLPLLILGGGGYNEVATVKAWVAATAAACGAQLPTSVPLHDFYAEYGPTFCFQHVSRQQRIRARSHLTDLNAFSGQQRFGAR